MLHPLPMNMYTKYARSYLRLAQLRFSPSLHDHLSDQPLSTAMTDTDLLPDAVIRCAPTIDALDKAIAKNMPLCPSISSGEQEFNHFWHNVFTSLAAEIEEDDTIPLHLTSPPRSTFSIKIFTKPVRDRTCWCDNTGYDFQIVLRKPIWCYQRDLVRGIRDYLYSEEGSQTRVFYRPGQPGDGLGKQEVDMKRVVVYDSTWYIMDNEEDIPDENETRFEGCTWKDPEIVLFCCTMEKVEERRKENNRIGDTYMKDAAE
ncbi:Putative protein of unknown function [Podospora comata]|uniref:Uncharacterized protein n=1 Tax=Podospora comata TaxID=48703 RepID=A0ABY6SJC4_PODCO|nr:Putative protein of unknown function [Podospora comata]